MGSAVSNTLAITVSGAPSVITIQAGSNSTGPFGSGSSYGWASGDLITFPPISHAVGSVSPNPCFLGPDQLGIACYLQGVQQFIVFVKGTAPQGLFAQVSFTDKFGTLETYQSAAATYDTTTYPGFTLWTWAALTGNTIPFTVGHSYDITFGAAPPVAAPVLTGLLNQLGSQILLSWTCATAGITAFTLYKNANNAGFVLYRTLAGTVFQLLDVITEDPIDDIDSAVYYLIAQVGTAVSGPSNEVNNEVPNARL